MRNRTLGATAAAGLAALLLASGLRAQAPAVTAITVPDMHCAGCAKKMAGQLHRVPGVAAVQADVPNNRLLVRHQPQRAPSPRGMWEAIERAGYEPSRLEGPGGTFTAKPRS